MTNRIADPPAPFSVYTSTAMWSDPHVSQQMLKYHLDPLSMPASRPHAFIDRSVAWLADRVPIGSGVSLLDLGCGPGLYSSRFAALGARVTGVDVSWNSLAYARQQAERTGIEASYLEGSYLEMTLPMGFDVAAMIFCDFSVLSPVQRRRLLGKVKGALGNGGTFVFDVLNLAALSRVEPTQQSSDHPEGGFWSPQAYRESVETFVYPDAAVSLTRHSVEGAHQTRVFYNWFQYYTPESITRLLETSGFVVDEIVGSVAGDPYSDDEDEMAVIATVAPPRGHPAPSIE